MQKPDAFREIQNYSFSFSVGRLRGVVSGKYVPGLCSVETSDNSWSNDDNVEPEYRGGDSLTDLGRVDPPMFADI